MNADPLTVPEGEPPNFGQQISTRRAPPPRRPYADHWSPCVCPRCRRGRNVTIVLAAIVGAFAWALLSAFIVPPAAAVAPWEWRPASGPFASLASHVFASTPRPAPDHATLVSPGQSGFDDHASDRARAGESNDPALVPATASGDARQVGAPTSPPATIVGTASFVPPSWGARYLALPGGRGITVRICGAAACIVRVSTDAGPDRAMQRAPYNRVADLSWADWQTVTGLSPARGLAPVSVEVVR